MENLRVLEGSEVFFRGLGEHLYCGRRYSWRNPGRNRIWTAHLFGTPEIDPV